jgi:hypothetical protein
VLDFRIRQKRSNASDTWLRWLISDVVMWDPQQQVFYSETRRWKS